MRLLISFKFFMGGEILMAGINLATAKKLIAAAEEEASNIGVQMVITVLDEGGKPGGKPPNG